MDPDQYANIMGTLGGISEHLVTLNGKVAKHEEKINTLIIWKATLNGAALPFKALWTIMIATISGLLVWILTKSR